MLTMWPPSRRCGRQSRVMRMSPFTFVSGTPRSSCSVEGSKESRASAGPAAFTRTSRPPSSPTARSTKRAQLAGSVTSSSSARSASRRSTRRAPAATFAPSRRSALAVAAPIPLDAPVTIAVLPSRAPTRLSLRRFERLPHELGDVDDDLAWPDLPADRADGVVQARVALVVAEMGHAPYELAPVSEIAPQGDHQDGAVVGLDDAAEVGDERAVGAAPWEVRRAEPPCHLPFAAAFGD